MQALPISECKLSPADREELILESMPLVYAIARRMIGQLSSEVCLEDLVSAGTVGLIHAVDSFDPRFDAKVNTYAAHRIRGAMLDSLRSSDWIPRRQRAHIKRFQDAMTQAQSKHGRFFVTDEEVAVELGVPVEEYREGLASLPVTRVVSLQESERDGEDIADRPGSQIPSEILERAELAQLLENSIRRLPPEEQTLIGLYYEEGMAPEEIAEIMKLPVKRIYQLKSQSILRLRSSLQRRLLRKPKT